MRTGLLVVLASLLSSCAAAAKDKGDPLSVGREPYHQCRKIPHTCGATDLPRVSSQEWSPPEIAAFLKRAEQGTVVVEREGDRAKIRPECRVPGTYASYPGKGGSGRLWSTNRPLLHPDEVGGDCAGATHLVATFARNGAQFRAILVPLPCPSTNDTRAAAYCLARGLTGRERLERSIGMQALLEPPLPELYPPRPKGPVEQSLGRSHAPGATGTSPHVAASTGRILEVWALAPDDYPTTRWLERISGDCALGLQGTWYGSAYTWGADRTHPHTEALPRPKPLQLQAEVLSPTNCSAWPVLIGCFRDVVEMEAGCLRSY